MNNKLVKLIYYKKSNQVLLTISFGWLLIQVGRQLFPPLLPTISADLSITPSQTGVLFGVLWGGYALLQYPSGTASDKLSRKTLLVTGILLIFTGFSVIFVAVSFPMLLFGIGIVAIGTGLYPTPAQSLIFDIYVDRRGKAIGLYTASGDLGNVLAAGIAAGALIIATWHAAFLPILLFLPLVLLLLHVSSRERIKFKKFAIDVCSPAKNLFSDGHMRFMIVIFSIYGVIWQSTTAFLPTFLQIEQGMTVGQASGGFALVFIVGTLVKPIAGSLGDQFGYLLVAIGSLLLTFIGMLWLIISGSIIFSYAAIVIFSIGLMSFEPVMVTSLMNSLQQDSLGTDLGAFRSLYIGVGSLGPVSLGFVASASNYTVAFIGLLPGIILCSLLLRYIE